MKKRSVLIAGHPTSVSLEEEFWEALKRVAQARDLSVNALIEEIDRTRSGNLSSAIRVHILNSLLARRADAPESRPLDSRPDGA
ncbi:putative DNA-binding ribbon-helix-helix protein [Azospirillum agricola]|uniref:ribbon-helix-helix domain-containing protein n=1 Tax=Azospirillum agricola TaxID=1720247 RepID=UPI001AE9506C|nr:ribbon-helix-helix domain-containing protein [Azospirillum agricola]MBP2230670.1 putative DNA-binding ribbon-helix-helix protein [Azospirillum agricola]